MEPERETAKTWRLGEACLLSLGVAAFTAIPTGLRTSRAGGSFADGLLVGAAVLLPVVTPSLVLARAAGRGFRGIAGTPLPRDVLFGIALWIGLALPALALLGTLLQVATHHRGLGGTTFAVFGAAVVALAAAVAHRLVALGRRLVERGVPAWAIAAIGATIGVVPLLVVAAPLASREGGEVAAAMRATIIDGAIAVVATALLSSLDVSASLGRFAGTWGPLLAGVVLVAGGLRVETSPAVGRAVRAGGGLPGTILGLLERWTDRDADGVGAHFGGDDCDEGDPSRRPGAEDVPGDGIDQDCDGIDAAPARDASDGRRPAEVVPAETMRAAPGASAAPRASASASAPPPPSTNAAAASGEAQAARPDIVLVTLDTVRADHTTPYGYATDTTPRLAELARRAVVFEHAYATGSDTRRALLPLVSGRWYSATARDRREWPTILDEVDTVAERLKRAGYVTAAVTSFTWLSEERGFAQGFDAFDTVFQKAHPERSVTGELAAAAAVASLRRFEPRREPLFLWVHFFDAHERHLEHPGIRIGRGAVGAYDGEIAFVDRQLGVVLDAVAASSRAARTAVLVHGTHGYAFDEHGTTGHGAELHDEVLRVPLVVAVPGAPAGRYAAGAVSTLDIPATVLDLAGAPAEGVAGRSLAPIAKGALTERRGPVYARSARRVALVDWPLKLLVFERKKRDRVLLFDLAADPGETKDLSASRPDDVARLTKLRETFEKP